MKADEDVKMISAEAPVLFAKACEMFIIELTHRSYYHTLENKRKTLQRSDISTTIASTDIYDFLQDIIPKEELREAQANAKKSQEEGGINISSNNNDILAAPLSLENTQAQKDSERDGLHNLKGGISISKLMKSELSGSSLLLDPSNLGMDKDDSSKQNK